ncbi:MAG TPA: hypothetical protein VK281_11020 [Xanthobacteraceae bacterium]|nr:hypothetical protein [Xanthobacteraceae bacterium]
MTDESKSLSLDRGPPSHHRIAGTDLAVAYNRRGDDLVVRVNKGPCQVFRVLLVDACKAAPSTNSPASRDTPSLELTRLADPT